MNSSNINVTSQVLSGQESPALLAWVRLLRGHAAATRALSNQLSTEHGLTINDYEALVLLSEANNEHMRRIDLAAALQLTASGVTRLLKGLEEAGLVEKATCALDARVTYAVLTEAGRDKLIQASHSHLRQVRRLFEARYNEEELVTLARLLQRLPGAEAADPGECTARREASRAPVED